MPNFVDSKFVLEPAITDGNPSSRQAAKCCVRARAFAPSHPDGSVDTRTVSVKGFTSPKNVDDFVAAKALLLTTIQPRLQLGRK
jgi:hypothetical protein